MQVKKFEAQNMKEALEMIKVQMGPDAIILSVRDHNAGFGLMGKKSIEVTAAISEKQIENRRWAEGRLNNIELLKLRSAPAKIQKQFIEKSMNRYVKPQRAYDEQRPTWKEPAKVRYIDIPEEGASIKTYARSGLNTNVGARVEDVLRQMDIKNDFVETSTEGSSRVKQAAKNALEAFEKSESSNTDEVIIESLKSEITNLKRMLFELKNSGEPEISIANYKNIQDKLVNSGISEKLVIDLIRQAVLDLSPSHHRPTYVEGWIAKAMMNEIKTVDHRSSDSVQIFIGPRGHGKTSSLVKLATHAILNENKKVAIFSADQNKVAATDQLKIYAQILNVPFGVIKSPQDWESVKANQINFDTIYVDFPGSSLKDIEEISDIRRLLPPVHFKKDIHLVLSVANKDHDAFEFAERYQFCGYKDVIFTFLDEALNHGIIYNFIKNFDIPLHSFGVGSKLPEDFELATRERVIDLIFKISKLRAEHL